VEPAARSQALAELRRVARPGALLFISALNRLGAYRGIVQWPGCDAQTFVRLRQTGLTAIGPEAAPTYLFLPDEFLGELEAVGLSVERLYGCQGLGAHIQEQNLLALMDDAELWSAWRDVLFETCDCPGIVGVSNLLLAVARCPEHEGR
jgi:hypothetical protein